MFQRHKKIHAPYVETRNISRSCMVVYMTLFIYYCSHIDNEHDRGAVNESDYVCVIVNES